MRLSAIRRLDDAVEDGLGQIARRLLGSWRHDHGSLSFFRASANAVYRFSLDGEPYFLRLTLASERSKCAVDAEIDLVEWLGHEGVCVPVVAPAEDGRRVLTAETESGRVHAVVFAGVSGHERTLEELTLADFRSWGSALGNLHAALRRYPAPTSPWESWREQLDFADKHVDDEVVAGEIAGIRETLAALPVDREHFGLIHGDFELDNLFWNGRISGIIDFESAVLHWRIADVALAIEPLADNEPARDAFLTGYEESSSLDERVWATREVFLRYSELLRHAKIVRSLDLPPQEVPPSLRALQAKLERRRDDYRARLEKSRRA